MILNFIDNKKYLSRLFKNIPRIEFFEASSIYLNRNGPTLELDLLIDITPMILPKKYLGQDLNASHIKVSLSPISNLNILNWGVNNIGYFEINNIENKLAVVFKNRINNEIIFKTDCKFIDLKEWVPYRKELP